MRAAAILTTALALLATACGAAQPRGRTAADVAREAEQTELARLAAAETDQRTEIRELQGRLALAQAEARDLRDAAEDNSANPPVRTVVIGRDGSAPDIEDDEGWQEVEPQFEEVAAVPADAPEPAGRRPVLRLYGRAAPPSDSGPLLLPPLPRFVAPRLAVAALPEAPAPQAAPFSPAVPRAAEPPQRPGGGEAVRLYRAALSLVRDRRFNEALPALDRFLRERPDHPYAPNAIYWKGEVHYARREYALALGQFERVVARYPRASKAADSLFKVGLCHRQMGDTTAARGAFEQVRRRYPDSVAARLAAEEDG